MQPLYIQAATAISPQHTFDRESFLRPLMHSGAGKLYALEAPYSQYISPVAIRRMSRILKLTISTAMQCLKESGVATPDAIITGTGRGSVTDMEQFVKDMIRMEEEALNPTLFIQSTYNSPNGWIAMQSSCTGYNQTYVHRGCSFELAVLDARMMAAETAGPMAALTGCYDEMTEEYYIIRGKRGYWKEEAPDSRDLLKTSGTPGTIGGEGAAFFVLAKERAAATSVIRDLRIIYGADAKSLCAQVMLVLESAGLKPSDISVVLTGLNGDSTQSGLYEECLKHFDTQSVLAGFKHLCGEYDTASGFGLWLADHMLREGIVPQEIIIKNSAKPRLEHILLINHYILGTASVWLLSRSIT